MELKANGARFRARPADVRDVFGRVPAGGDVASLLPPGVTPDAAVRLFRFQRARRAPDLFEDLGRGELARELAADGDGRGAPAGARHGVPPVYSAACALGHPLAGEVEELCRRRTRVRFLGRSYELSLWAAALCDLLRNACLTDGVRPLTSGADLTDGAHELSPSLACRSDSDEDLNRAATAHLFAYCEIVKPVGADRKGTAFDAARALVDWRLRVRSVLAARPAARNTYLHLGQVFGSARFMEAVYLVAEEL
jgi:hypothetical protein